MGSRRSIMIDHFISSACIVRKAPGTANASGESFNKCTLCPPIRRLQVKVHAETVTLWLGG